MSPCVTDVVLVDAPGILAPEEDLERLAGRELAQLRDHHLDHEASARLEVRRDVPEARDLRRLGREVHDRVVDEVRRDGTTRPPWSSRCRRSSRRCPCRRASRAASAPSPPTVRSRAPAHRARQRQRDPARPDRELERSSTSGQLDEEIHRRLDDRRIEHLRRMFRRTSRRSVRRSSRRRAPPQSTPPRHGGALLLAEDLGRLESAQDLRRGQPRDERGDDHQHPEGAETPRRHGHPRLEDEQPAQDADRQERREHTDDDARSRARRS